MTKAPRHAGARRPLLGAIWAEASNGIIGAQGAMPWHVPEDLAHFKRVTANHPVIMGRATWESFPAKFRPLPGRTNIVLSTHSQAHDRLRAAGAVPATELGEALRLARDSEGGEEIWIIGGGKVYAEALSLLDLAVITKLDLCPEGDTSAPRLGSDFSLATSDPAPDAGGDAWHTSSGGTRYRFETWIREKD